MRPQLAAALLVVASTQALAGTVFPDSLLAPGLAAAGLGADELTHHVLKVAHDPSHRERGVKLKARDVEVREVVHLLLDLLLTLLVAVTWGLNFVIAKLGVAEMPPIFLVTLRFALVAALLVPFVRFPRGRFVPLLVLAMTLGTLHFSLMFSALNSIDASVAAVAIQTQVPFAAILSAILFKDPPGWRRVLGMVVAIGGVALLAGALTGRLTPAAARNGDVAFQLTRGLVGISL